MCSNSAMPTGTSRKYILCSKSIIVRFASMSSRAIFRLFKSLQILYIYDCMDLAIINIKAVILMKFWENGQINAENGHKPKKYLFILIMTKKDMPRSMLYG